MNMRQRKALGCLALLGYLAIYALFAASVGVWLAPLLPTWAELVFYLIAGVVWIFPLKPLMRWMSRPD